MDPIALGSVGEEVLDVQRRLEDLGLDLGDDAPGVFGSGTHQAVRVFQQRRGLTADGVVGEDTWRSLVEAGWQLGDRHLYQAGTFLRGDDIRELQRRLNRLGFDAGHVDGVFGPDTADAVRDFQLNVGLKVDGIAGRDTIEVLRRLHRQHQESPAFAVREREQLRQTDRQTVVGAAVMVDPGHSPSDPGALAPDDTPEHRITWQIANRIAGRLSVLGVHVVMSRGPSNSPSSSERAQLANREEVDAVLSIHLNALRSPEARGAAAYYFGEDGYVSERGRRLAQLAVDNVVARTGTPNCRTHPSTSAVLRETKAPAVVVEPGFVTHPEEGRALLTPDRQGQIAHALADAVITFLVGAQPTGGATPADEVVADVPVRADG
ncbi:MAG: N-acetylmuramoyl-L-alanine amidase [Nitriliruptorales bacterium]|nr:N-acetylmuramoyl-L-alanine amidase [Nitriliruptorales bacterium]